MSSEEKRSFKLQYITITIIYFQKIGRVTSSELRIYLSFLLPTKLLPHGMQISTCLCSRSVSIVSHCPFRFVCLCIECTCSLINLLKPTGYMMHQQVQHSRTVGSAHTEFMFFIYLKTNSDLCHVHHKLVGFYNRDENCLLRGRNWVFK
jgi:hypothetical protein